MTKARDFLEELGEEALPFLPEVTKQPSALLLQPIEQDVIAFSVQGLSVDDIALRLATPKSVIQGILVRKDVQEELRVAIESMNDRRLNRINSIIDTIVDARLEEYENPSEATKRDLVDILKIQGDLLSAEKKSRKPDAEQNIYVNILNQVMGD
jgi:hypothetical protein